MQKTLTILFLLLMHARGEACIETLRAYPDECRAQDRFVKLNTEFTALSLNMTELKGFQVPKAVGKSAYFNEKNEILNKGHLALDKNANWQQWIKGQNYVNDLSLAIIGLDDVLKLHRAMFATKTFFDSAGKLRVHSGETNPKMSFSCEDKFLSEELLGLLISYDLTSSEGYPLLTLDNIGKCSDGSFHSGELHFYKGASVKLELGKWVVELNDMINRYETGNAPKEIGPYKYMADMRRWFLAIRPFNQGNDEVVSALMDYTTRRLNLPALPLMDPVSPIFKSVDENRTSTLKKVNEALDFFEGCLFETKTKLISLECTRT